MSAEGSSSNSRRRQACPVRLPYLAVLQIRLLGLLWGLWSLGKQLMRRLIVGRSSRARQSSLPSPPRCLLASTLGRHSYVKIKGTKLHYVEAGSPRGPLLLLLHGFPDLWISWRHQIPELAKYYRVIAVDMKGFGDSDKPEARSSYQIERLTGELTELVTSLGYKKCCLVGHDMGGLLAWYWTYRSPRLIERLVLISAPHPDLYWDATATRSPFNKQWMQFCQLPVLPELKALENDLSLISKVYGHLDNTIENKSFLTAYKYSFSRREDWTGALNYFRTLALYRLEAEEGSVTTPALLLVGNRDSREFFEAVVKSTVYLNKYSLKVIENASHYPHHERPSEVNKTILHFLRGDEKPGVEDPNKSPSGGGLVTRMFGAAVSTTSNLSSGVLGVVKRANQTGLRAISFGNSS